MSAPSRPLFALWIFVLIGLRLVVPPLLSSYLLATLLEGLGLFRLSPFFWIAGAPALYLAWLFLYLLTCCAETFLFDCFVKKPEICTRRASIISSMRLVILTQYARAYLIDSLPYTQLMVGANGLRQLVLRAYSPRTHLSHTCQLSTLISDPDATHIGDNCIVGGRVELVAHSFVRQLDGDSIYKSAPIHIGRNVTIGGNARVELGVTVGDGALIEPFSHVMAYTTVGAGEVWAGNPAACVRRREGAASTVAPARLQETDTAVMETVLPVIARALNLLPEKLTSETRMEEVLEWDSLGKIAIAAALHDRFGLDLEPEQIFGLDSVSHILQFLTDAPKLPSLDPCDNEQEELPRDIELLPLSDPAAATAALARRALPDGSRPLRICIAATTVAEPIAPTLQLWCRAFDIKADVIFAGFDQVHACLLQPDSLFFSNGTGLNVVIAGAEDLAGSSAGDLSMRATQFLEAIEAFARHVVNPFWVTDLPPPLLPLPFVTAVELFSVRALWTERLAANPKVRLLPFSSIIEELGLQASANPAGAASTRYSAAVYQRLGIEVSRAARQFHHPPRKVLALDADDTLWEGIVGEDGPERIKVEPRQRQLQLRAKAFKEAGGLLVLLSRNESEDVWAVWDHEKNMVLQRDDFAVARINWKTKSENLLEVAAELNLGLDSFVFIDDNPAERIDVEARCPGVLSVPAPVTDAEDPLGRLWCFDQLAVTAEDRERTALIQQEARRRDAVRDSEGDYVRYLRSLDLQVTIRRAKTEDLPRVAQLTQKTNQFNVSLRRRTQAELEQLSGCETWTISAQDRFGDYGMIGVGILHRNEKSSEAVILDSFLLSCRALAGGIELASLHILCEKAARSGARVLVIPFTQGPRNQPVLNFLDQNGWKRVEADQGELRLPASLQVPTHLQIIQT